MIASLATAMVPVARAFADVLPAPAAQTAMTASHRKGSPDRSAHRMPRLRKPKQTLAALLPESSAFLPADVSARRGVPLRERVPRAASFAALPDHPPA